MSRSYRILCGTPEEHCTGSKLVTDQKLGTTKCHMSRPQAFQCHVRYLIRVKGMVRVGMREFQSQEGGPIEVLPKQSHFGAKLRLNKPARFMPALDESNRGVII